MDVMCVDNTVTLLLFVVYYFFSRLIFHELIGSGSNFQKFDSFEM